jgi:hypothetical protein
MNQILVGMPKLIYVIVIQFLKYFGTLQHILDKLFQIH